MTTADTVQTLTSTFLTALAAVGAVYGVLQIREARKARLLGPYFEMDRRLQEQSRDRGVMFSREDDDSDEWTRAFNRVAPTLDVLGALVREDMIYQPIVFKIYYDVIIKCWKRSEDRIRRLREERKSTTYMSDFQYLAEIAEEWRQRMGHPIPRITRAT